MFKSVIYHASTLLGEADFYPQNQKITPAWTREIRISHLSPPSERCPPLAVLRTIAPSGPSVRIESRSLLPDESPLFLLHATCLREKKTAVISLGDEELHLVAMPSRRTFDKCCRFWGFSVVPGLYNSSLVMLNLRCLGIVFDLDETLIVANTMRSFEDRIESLQRKANAEIDPQRLSGMLAEIKRYQDDQSILKQYVENDQVVDSGKVFKVQSELVPPPSDGHQPMIRPIIRLQEKNIILTRINPMVRDTSVLVRLRPAWDDLRSYLTARGRKRFEVYVCTMAERDYALEMWRLLDPEGNLIHSKQLIDRIVCVKSGSKKSLFNVFQYGNCHPRMALVIDDRLKVWDDKDQQRVHVVPAFAPYHAPHAEANGTVPVLCVARNVACNVRGSFFKDFDDGLLPRISDVFFEDDLADLPAAPDVSNYLILEDDTSVSNGSKDPLSFDGMADAEVEKRLKANFKVQAAASILNNLDPRSVSGLQQVLRSALPDTAVKPLPPPGVPDSREEGEVPESELDPNTRRRLLILQHGMDSRDHVPSEPALPARVPLQVSIKPLQPHGSWYPLEEEMSPRKLSRGPKEFAFEPEGLCFEKNRPFFNRVDSFPRPERPLHESQRAPKEMYHGEAHFRPRNAAVGHYHPLGDDVSIGRASISSSRNGYFDSWPMSPQFSDTPTGVLVDIASKCGDKVEFRSALVDSTELQFSIERLKSKEEPRGVRPLHVWFVGEKVGEGIGKTRKEAQRYASESSLRNLAHQYLSTVSPDIDSMADDTLPVDRPRTTGAADYAALKELCAAEGFSLNFLTQPAGASVDSGGKGEVTAQVEIGGQLLGKGSGMSREVAKLQAAQEALANLQSMLGHYPQKRSSSPRLGQAAGPGKRLKQDPRVLQRVPSARYSRDDGPLL
ncbi:C-terminal domain phosphatase-like 1 isoform X2 [Wolffia australiana]